MKDMCFAVQYFAKQRVIGFREHVSNSNWFRCLTQLYATTQKWIKTHVVSETENTCHRASESVFLTRIVEIYKTLFWNLQIIVFTTSGSDRK